MKTLKQIREASGGKEAYQKFFNSLLKKFGVSSPSELKGDKKKEFYDAIDAGWEGDNEKPEKNETYGDPDNLDPDTTTDPDEEEINASYGKMNAGKMMASYHKESVNEAKKLKAGRGKAEIDINFDGDRKDIKFATTKYMVKIKPHRDGAIVTGDKAKILAYLQGQDYAMDPEDIEDLYPELSESSSYPKPLSIIRQVKEFSGDAETVRRKRRRFEADEEEAHKMNEKMVMCEHCGKMHEEGACGDMNESEIQIKGISKAKHAAIKKKYNVTIDSDSTGTWAQGKPADLYKWAMDKKGLGMSKGDIKKTYNHITPEYKGASNIKNKQREEIEEAKEKKLSPSMKNQIHKIAKKHSGDMEAAMKEISKMKVWKGKGIQDHSYVMDTLKTHNEEIEERVDVDGRLIGFKSAQRRSEGEKQKGKVIVDRRTKGYKEAKLRSEKAKAKREAKKKEREFAEKYPSIDYAYGDDAELRKTMEAASKVLMGETAANAVAHGGVDMAPNAGKKKKDKEKLMAKRGY